MKKITYQITAAIIGSCLILGILLTVVSTYLSQEYMLREAEDKLQNLSTSYANEFGIELSHVENTVDILYHTVMTTFDVTACKQNPEQYMGEYSAFIEPIIKRTAESIKDIQGIYFTANPELTGKWHEIWYANSGNDNEYKRMDMNIQSLEELNPQNPLFQYYFLPLEKKKPVWMDPYIDGTIGVYMVSYVIPIYKDNEVIGIIGSDMRMGSISETIKKMKVYQTGLSMLINEQEEVIIHPELVKTEPFHQILGGTYSKVKLELEPVNHRKMQERAQIKHIDYLGHKALIAYTRLTNNWVLAIQAPLTEVLQNSRQLTGILIGIGIGGMIMASMIAVLLGRVLEKLINQNMEKTAQTQQHLVESERIASLSYLVSGVAHEINTPVGNSITLTTFIEGEAKTAVDQIEKNTIKKQQLIETLNEIGESSVHIYKNLSATQKIITAFKELATTKISGHVAFFDLEEQVHQVYETLNDLTGVNVKLTLRCPRGLRLRGDARLFSQILYHLINNSIIHGFESRVEGHIEIDFESLEDGVRMLYKDNGSGIPSELINSIYVPFFSTKFNSENRGLGMNVVYNIIRGAFSGNIQLNSAPEQGVAIEIILHHCPMPYVDTDALN